MTAHTPGPWEEYTVTTVHNDGHAEEVIEIAVNGTHPTVAYVHEVADARLIAAAPDLLAALMECADEAAHALDREEDDDETEREVFLRNMQAIRLVANTAIANAEQREATSEASQAVKA